MFEKIKRWWNGEDIFHKNNPNDPVIFIGWNNKKHWTSILIHSLLDFYMKHWQWIWGIVVNFYCCCHWCCCNTKISVRNTEHAIRKQSTRFNMRLFSIFIVHPLARFSLRVKQLMRLKLLSQVPKKQS